MPRNVALKVAAVKPLTEEELEQISVVFHTFETGVRSGAIHTQDLLPCMKTVGMNPTEQEIIDMSNEVEKKGVIYFEDFCKLVLRKYREEDEEEFIKIMFKHLCGTDPHPKDFRAKKYKVNQRFMEKKDFLEMMQCLPVQVDIQEAEEMFSYADKDRDNKISWTEFQTMINPPPPPKPPTPHKSQIMAFMIDNPAFEDDFQNTIYEKIQDTNEIDPANKEKKTEGEEENEENKEDERAKKEEEEEKKRAKEVEAHNHKDKSENHRKKCAICLSKEVKPVVETDISRAASAFAKDSTRLHYSWRNDKANIEEKEITIKGLKKGEDV